MVQHSALQELLSSYYVQPDQLGCVEESSQELSIVFDPQAANLPIYCCFSGVAVRRGCKGGSIQGGGLARTQSRKPFHYT